MLPKFIPKRFPVAIWKLREISVQTWEKQMYLQKNQGVSKQSLSVKLKEEETGATDQSGW